MNSNTYAPSINENEHIATNIPNSCAPLMNWFALCLNNKNGNVIPAINAVSITMNVSASFTNLPFCALTKYAPIIKAAVDTKTTNEKLFNPSNTLSSTRLNIKNGNMIPVSNAISNPVNINAPIAILLDFIT